MRYRRLHPVRRPRRKTQSIVAGCLARLRVEQSGVGPGPYASRAMDKGPHLPGPDFSLGLHGLYRLHVLFLPLHTMHSWSVILNVCSHCSGLFLFSCIAGFQLSHQLLGAPLPIA